ncbi:MAG: DUF368 domain-containing protein [Flammeovirgaceae bacterium]|nr:DUF368 domain-containing protein [Flammeovirgaceae bacterium]
MKGIAMGAADVVPGVSGGTIAFISGIYEELLSSIKAIDIEAIRLFFTGKWKLFWQKINGTFLLVLLSGIATAIVSMSKVILYLLEHYPILIWSFFFGLVLASIVLIAQKINAWRNVFTLAFLFVGTLVSYYITTITTVADESAHLGYIFLCGVVAICAMILPGISGSFILLLMGAYHLIIGSIRSVVETLTSGQFEHTKNHLLILLIFGTGAILGIISFSRVLTWLYKHYHDWVIALLTGFLIGSLNKIWPWKQTILELKGTHTIDKSISPFAYEALTGHPPMLGSAILLAIVGFLLVYGLEKIAAKMQNNKL